MAAVILSQPALARRVGVSRQWVNYCVKQHMESKGLRGILKFGDTRVRLLMAGDKVMVRVVGAKVAVTG